MTRRTRWIFVALTGVVSALSLGGYLLAARLAYRSGFPLDDAWIHQTYARSLVEEGQFAYLPGRPSAGSTAPLWSVLLAAGYALRLEPLAWASMLGWLTLWALALTGALAFAAFWQALRGTADAPPLWMMGGAGLILALEWHLVWAAASGMETLLAGLISLLTLALLARPQVNGFAVGLLIGAGVWVRPDGLALLGPAFFVIILRAFAIQPWRRVPVAAARPALYLLACFGLCFLPYLAFNYSLAGTLWPNTYYAKQAEYAVLLQAPLWLRYLREASLPLVGVGVLFLPGALWMLWRALRARAWAVLAAGLWFLGYLVLYALRLPVMYQHGRYVMPAMAVFFILGWCGMSDWAADAAVAWRRVVAGVWRLSTLLVLLAFWLIGARAYASDVTFVEREMVDTARWLAQNTPPEALIAAHDIGAIGYVARRPLLDLAGLISPEVIPILRDETRLSELMAARGVSYLVTLRQWYTHLGEACEEIHASSTQYEPASGGDNMVVYRCPVR